MGNDTICLATGFAGLDRRDDVAVFADCLRLLDAFPAMRAIKDESLSLLAVSPGDLVLEAGCGLGAEARAMASRVGATGLAVGLDASRAMLAGAAATDGPAVSWVQADAGQLPLASSRFAACRVERMLQHVPDPGAVVAELARVLRPGGQLVALEPDWGTFVVDSRFRATTRTVLDTWCDSFQSGWVGRTLPRLLADAGLADIAVLPRSMPVHGLAEAEAIFNLLATADRAVAAGRLRRRDADAFAAEQRNADARGLFFACLTFIVVVGRKVG